MFVKINGHVLNCVKHFFNCTGIMGSLNNFNRAEGKDFFFLYNFNLVQLSMVIEKS